MMNAGEVQDDKIITREPIVQAGDRVPPDVLAGALKPKMVSQASRKRDFTVEPAAGQEPADKSSFPLGKVDVTKLIKTLQQLEILARRQTPRIAVKAKGRILFLDVFEILAVEAEGNYISLRHRTTPYLLRESLSSMAEKLQPYGFIRIHRSAIVNISAVEEIEPLPTGEYRLRIRGGKEYMVTRTYKENLRDLAQLW